MATGNMKILVVLACLLSLSGQAAQAQGRPVNLIGSGALGSCGKWLEERRQDTFWMMSDWALGYISGAATYGDIGNPLGGTDSQGVLYWLDNFCSATPATDFLYAVKAFIKARAP